MLLIALGVQAGVSCSSYDLDTQTATFDYSIAQSSWLDQNSGPDPNNIKSFIVKGTIPSGEALKNIINLQKDNTIIFDLSKATLPTGFDLTLTDLEEWTKFKAQKLILPDGYSLPTDESLYGQVNWVYGKWNGAGTLRYACALSADGKTINIVGGIFANRGDENAIADAITNNEYPFNVEGVTSINIVADFGTNYITDADKAAINEFNAASIQTSFDATTGTLTLSLSDLNAAKDISTIVTDLANLTNKNQINTIVFPDETTYEVASGKFTPSTGVASNVTTWLTTNGYTVDGSFNAITGTLTLANLDSNVSAFVSNTNLTSLSNKDQVNTIVFPDGSTYQVVSGKYTAAPESANTETYKTWLTTNEYTVDGSYDAASGTLTLANLSSSVSTLVSNIYLSDLNNKNDIKTIVFPDGSSYDVASQKLSAATVNTITSEIETWLNDNGYTVTTTEAKIGDFITWDSTNNILTIDYTAAGSETLSSYTNLINNDNANGYAIKNRIAKIVIKSDASHQFPASDLSSMTDWNQEKIMDLTQAKGIDGTITDITDQSMKCSAIYLPSNISFPDPLVYEAVNSSWHQGTLEYVCQLKDDGELIVGATKYNTSDSHPANAIAAALNQSPLEYPFSEATKITLATTSSQDIPTQTDKDAVAAFNATTYDAGTHTLTLSASDLSAGKEANNIGTIATNLSFNINDIQVIKFPDGSTYNVASKTLTAAENSTNINDNIQWLIKNGYSDIVKTEIGKYVSVVDGKTILTIPDDEPEVDKDVVTSNIENSTMLSTAEKNALKSATNLVVVGEVTENDWGGLQHIAATTLDLAGAKIGNTFALANALRENVKNLTLPNDVDYTKVPDNFAYNALALQSVTFPSQITEIGDRAFFGCGNLASVDLPANLTTIGESAFQDSGLKTLVLPGKLTTVRKDAFFDCRQLENVEMKMLDGSCTFGDRAFGSCFQLKHVTLSEGVDAISTQMFDKCGMLESIRIPSTCKTIGQEAFNICASLHSIVIPEGVDLIEKQAFTNSGITDIYVMATTKEKVPAIYSMGSNWGGNDSTFGSAMVTGNSHDPYNAHKDDIATADGETVLSWYQEEMSDGRLGVGGGDCLVRLHYPEEMRYFYDGFDNPLLTNGSWTPEVKDALSQAEIDAKKAVIDAGDTHYISEGYTVGTTQYPAFGPDKQGNYWPTRTDYLLRLQAGDPAFYEGSGLTEPSSLGWRQLPLHQVSKPDDFVFTKEYDDTWYTMCFPWDMEDNTLFSAFNQKLEIVEFVGAEVKEETTGSTKQLNLVFHFDEVAKAYYMTENHRTDELKYERVEDHIEDGKNTTRTENITIEGNVIKKKYYTYHRVNGTDGPEYVYWPFDLPAVKSSYTAEQKAMVDRYNSILHLMVFAGHPYMIHPSVGAKPNNPVICSIAGVKKLSATDYPNLASDNAVTKATTTDGTFQHPGTTYYDGQKSHYTFIGNVDEYAADATPAQKRKMMTDAEHPHAYFLAVDPTQSFYPKYYRKSKDNEKVASWSQYSAIIRPDAAAIADIEKYMNLNTNGSTPSSAKPFDIEFGKWEVVDVTAIEEIISEAERKNQTVEKVHLNVVFNIKGQVIREGSDSVDGLPKGLYIVNGKKYMVK